MSPVICEGRCDSFGDARPSGDFIRLVYATPDVRHGIVLTQSEALGLIAAVAEALASSD